MKKFTCCGIANRHAVLDEAAVRSIRERYSNRLTVRCTMGMLAKEFGVSSEQIRRIVHRLLWKYLP